MAVAIVSMGILVSDAHSYGRTPTKPRDRSRAAGDHVVHADVSRRITEERVDLLVPAGRSGGTDSVGVGVEPPGRATAIIPCVNVLTLTAAPPELGRFDWAVDRRPLGKWASRWTARMPVPALNGVLPTHDTTDLYALLATDSSRLTSGRVPLYTCGLCGDVACGVLAVRVAEAAEVVTWSDFAWDNGLAENSGPDPDFAEVPVIRFDRTAYTHTIRQALSR